MKQPENSPILVIEKPFKNTSMVICGWCNGAKVINVQDEIKVCPYCLGEGLLRRVTEGTMKLFTQQSTNH